MTHNDSIGLYEALLEEAERGDEDAAALLRSQKQEIVERLLEKRLAEHRTGRFTTGATRTARTLFDLIVRDLRNPGGAHE